MWCRHFQNNSNSDKYSYLKNLFLEQLNLTAIHCKNNYLKKYDQERNYAVSEHPEITTKLSEIEYNKKKITDEINQIEKNLSPLKCAQHFIDYVKTIMDNPSKSLFIQVLKGKLKKKWQVQADLVKDSFSDINSQENESNEVVKTI